MKMVFVQLKMILGEMYSFYDKLYTSKNINDVKIDNYISNIEISSLSSVD